MYLQRQVGADKLRPDIPVAWLSNLGAMASINHPNPGNLYGEKSELLDVFGEEHGRSMTILLICKILQPSGTYFAKNLGRRCARCGTASGHVLLGHVCSLEPSVVTSCKRYRAAISGVDRNYERWCFDIWWSMINET